MRKTLKIITAAAAASVLLAGCASDGSLPLSTASLPQKKEQKAKKPSAKTLACMQLRDRIIALRAEGTVGRVEKAASGKSRVVTIKRASLSKVAELNAANADYQASCSIVPPTTAQAPAKKEAAVKPAAKPAKVAAAAPKAPAAKK